MMKIALFLAVGLVAIFNSPVTAEITEQDGQEILDAIKVEVANRGLKCAGVDSYCSQTHQSQIPANICPAVLKAHLCDNVNTGAGIYKVLEDLAKQSANNSKN